MQKVIRFFSTNNWRSLEEIVFLPRFPLRPVVDMHRLPYFGGDFIGFVVDAQHPPRIVEFIIDVRLDLGWGLTSPT